MFPDPLDKRLLKELLADSRRSVRQLAKALDQSPSTVYNRINKLKKNNVIKSWTVTLDYKRLNLNTTAFVLVEINGINGVNFDHQEIGYKIAEIEGVYSIYLISGNFDILVQVRAETIEAIGDLILNQIRNIQGVSKTVTNTCFKTIMENGDK